jgi:hypothetical protein
MWIYAFGVAHIFVADDDRGAVILSRSCNRSRCIWRCEMKRSKVATCEKATAQKAYEEAIATALKAYKEARATVLKDYEKAVAPGVSVEGDEAGGYREVEFCDADVCA